MDRTQVPRVLDLPNLIGASERLAAQGRGPTPADWLGLVEEALDRLSTRPLRLPPIPQFEVHAGGKARLVAGLPSLHRLVCEALRPRLEAAIAPHLPPSLHSYRRGRSALTAATALAGLLDDGFRCLWLSDVAAFFPSIDRVRLGRALAEVCDKPTAELVVELLATPVRGPSGHASPPGLLLGNPLSPLLANLYLTPLDRRMDALPVGYLRYGDDLAVAARSPADLDAALHTLQGTLADLGLSIAADKTHRLDYDGRPVPYLGLLVDHRGLYEPRRAATPSTPRLDPAPAPSIPLARTLYVAGDGVYCSAHAGHLRFRKRDGTTAAVPTRRVRRVLLLASCGMSSGFIHACLGADIPILLFARNGRDFGALVGAGTLNPLRLRAEYQLRAESGVRLALARDLLDAKLRAQLLRLKAREAAFAAEPILRLRNRIAEVDDIERLRGLEGAATAAYYRGFAARIRKPGFALTTRSRRPPRDPINSLLSFTYSLLFGEMQSLLLGHGLDPFPGFLHDLHRDHPALASDLIEPYRSLIADTFVLTLVNGGMLKPEDFETKPWGGVVLKAEPRNRFIGAYEAFMSRPLGPGAAASSPRLLLALAARAMLRVVLGETPRLLLPLAAGEAEEPAEPALVIGDGSPVAPELAESISFVQEAES